MKRKYECPSIVDSVIALTNMISSSDDFIPIGGPSKDPDAKSRVQFHEGYGDEKDWDL